MHWYAALVDKANLGLRTYLDAVRGAVLSMDDEDEEMGMFFENFVSFPY